MRAPVPFIALTLLSALSGVAQAADDSGIRVQLSAHRHTVLSSELAGKLTQVTVREGEAFKAGQTLVAFDCAIHKARLSHSYAAENAANKKLAIARKLDKLNSISVADVAQAEADRAMARAESGVNRVMVKRCTISAPFAGRVAERKVQPQQYVGEGTELLSIYANDSYDVELIAPSDWLRWLKPGQPFRVQLDETGETLTAKIVRIGAVVDAVSRSIKVIGRIDSHTSDLLPGMSGVAHIAPPMESTP